MLNFWLCNRVNPPATAGGTDLIQQRLCLYFLLWSETNAREDVGELAFGAELREDGIDFEVH